MNLFLHGVEDFHIVNDDTLKNPAFIEHGQLQQFDIVLANAREVFGLTTRNRINKGFPGHTPLFLCPEIRAVRHRMAA